MKTLTFITTESFQKFMVVMFLSILFLCGCGSTTVFKDKFNPTPFGQPPGPPETGTSTITSEVRIGLGPSGDEVTPESWLELVRVSPPTGTQAEYIATFTEPVFEVGTVALIGYVPAYDHLPEYDPVTFSLYFEPPVPAPNVSLLHIDLKEGNILVNDNSIEGTYKYNKKVTFLITFKLSASPPTADIIVRGGDQDANTTVNIPTSLANFGLGKVRIQAPFLSRNSSAGFIYVDDVIAIKKN